MRIKKTYVCRNVQDFGIMMDIPLHLKVRAGDVGIFEVLHIGKHSRVQDDSKRNVMILEGDYIMAAFGTRYATAQIEGYLPEHLDQELHILGAGGTVGVVKSIHIQFQEVGPTKLKLVGLAKSDDGQIINTKKIEENRITPFNPVNTNPGKVILSLGSSMDSGKTTSAAYLVHGLKSAGMNVAYIKLTGTIYTKDADLAFDLGADISRDFGDFGFPSTYMCEEEELLDLYESLLEEVRPAKPDYIIMEIADGLFQRETRILLTQSELMARIDGVMFSAGDSLSAVHGVELLKAWGVTPNCISGLFTTSPLLIEEVKQNTNIPVYNIQELSLAEVATGIFERKTRRIKKLSNGHATLHSLTASAK